MDKLKGERKKLKRKFTEAIKTFDGIVSEKSNIEILKSYFEKVRHQYDQLCEIQDEIADLLIDTDPDADLDDVDKYSEELRITFKKRVSIMENNTCVSDEEGNACESKPSSDHQDAIVDILGKLTTLMDSKPTQQSSTIEGIRVPKWNGEDREYYSWKRLFLTTMKQGNQVSEHIIIARILNAIPEVWRTRIALCETLIEVWKEFEVVITKNRVQEMVYGDFKRIRRIKEPNEVDIRQFISEVRLFIRRMCDLDKKAETETDACLSDIRFKIGEQLNLNYSNFIILKGEDPNLESLLEYLAREATIRGISCRSQIVSKADNNSKHWRPGGFRQVNNVQSGNRPTSCPFGCREFHYVSQCPAYIAMSVQERIKWIQDSRRCFRCLKEGHRVSDCRSRMRCGNCNGNHHVSIHFERQNREESEQPRSTLSPDAPPFVRTAHISEMASDLGTILPVVLVEVIDNDGRPQAATALLDGGSDTSLIRSGFVEKLGLSGDETQLNFGTAGGAVKREKSRIVDIQVTSDFTSEIFHMPVYTIGQPCHDVKTLNCEFFEENPHLKRVRQSVFTKGGQVDLLIGSDQALLLRDLECVQAPSHPEKRPIAVKCVLGWYITGNSGSRNNLSKLNNVRVYSFSKVEENFNDVEKMIQGDLLGVAPTRLCACSDQEIEESLFIKHVRSTTERRPNHRLRVRTPWKENYPEILPDNMAKAIKQLEYREKQLKRDGEVEEYNYEIQQLLKREVVRVVTPEELQSGGKGWYLNHRSVKRPDKSSTKLRIVFDSAAEFKGFSLNKSLEKGPNYLNSLMSCLIGWREKRVAATGDISKMFNQIELHPEDQPYHRFLWRDCDESQEPRVYQWLRVPFGDKSSPDLANYCVKSLAHEFRDSDPAAFSILTRRTYVDDVCLSENNVEQVRESVEQTERVLAEGSFPIKTWNSNNSEIDQAPDECEVDVLGLTWNKMSDEMKLKAREIPELHEKTKRTILSLISKFWDPLGILTPCFIKYRVALQNLWASGVDWDQPIPESDWKMWDEYRLEMMRLVEEPLDRCLTPDGAVGSPQLHGFSDAGELAYGACCFLRWKMKNGEYKCTFVMSKSLVAPIKKRSIPRLELMACVVLSRLMKSVEESLSSETDGKFMWTDSTTVLRWLQCPPRKFKSFVGSRIAEIQETHNVDHFRYVPSEMNPADQLTKHITLDKLRKWYEGPAFLRMSEDRWPVNPTTKECCGAEGEIDREFKLSENQKKQFGRVQVAIATDDKEDIDRFLNAFKTCKSWDETVNKMAARNRELKQRQVAESTPKPDEPFSVRELEIAKQEIYKLMQRDFDPKDARYQKLSPWLDESDGLYKSNSRLNKSYLPELIKFPIILPKESREFNLLIAKHYHEKCAHAGYRRVKSEIHGAGLWICGVRDLLRSVAAKCMYCRTRRRPLLEQKMGQLPDFRVKPYVKPFENSAVDFFGPVQIKYGGRSVIEGHVCIFTCMVTRAIHLELCTDMSAETFILAWRRFASVRGPCKFVWSDNGGNFTKAADVLKRMIQQWDESMIKSELAKNGTDFQWKFNVAYASHMNGVVESLIRSVRRGLESICGLYDVKYTYEEWNTFLQEVTYLVNSRPLFPESDDILDCPSITPNSLLLGHGIEVPQPTTKADERINPRDRHSAIQRRVQVFWESWLRNMPPQLLERNKWFHSRENLQVGDLVLLTKPGLKGAYAPRGTWERGVITETYPGDDGLVRKAKVRTVNGEYMRPIHKMCLIASKDELDDAGEK